MHRTSMILSLVTLILFGGCTAQAEPLTIYTDGATIVVTDLERDHLRVSPMFWGPGWKYSGGGRGSFSRQGDAAFGTFQGQLKDSELAYQLKTTARLEGQTLIVRYVLDPKTPGKCRLMAIGIEAGDVLDGQKAVASNEEGTKEVELPFSTGSLGKEVTRIRLGSGTDSFDVKLSPDRRVATDQRAARVILAEGDVPAKTQTLELTIELPAEAVLYAEPSEAPKPDNWNKWFAWEGQGNVATDSVISLQNWLEAPAGKHGRIEMKGQDLIYNSKPIKIWGLNNAYGACAPKKELADARAELYSKYGVNGVRLHKLADGPDWAGIQSKQSVVEFDPEGLDRLDYYVAALKKKGIYVKFSVALGWGQPMGPADVKYVPYLEELGQWKGKGRGARRIDPGDGAIYFSPEIQTVKILQLVNLLKHKNPYTGLTYAEDPAVFLLEMTNEESIYWYTSMKTMLSHKRLRDYAARKFTRWLKQKYQTKQAMLDAWGKEGGLNVFTHEEVSGESWEEDTIVPVGNAWFFHPDNLNTSQAYRRARLLDTMAFLHELQNEFYDRFKEEIRKAGYEGLVEASNWQAGSAMSHFYNLHSDSRIGLVDRHNYYSNGPSMLRVPGSGTLSSGLQQVAGLPFSISEWIHTFPNERGMEGPAIFGAYGMGLQDWDISFMFENTDDGRFSDIFGRQRWDVTAPHIMGLFPAVARQVLRDDVKPSRLLAKRNVHVPSLVTGKMDFSETVEQQHDIKVINSDKVPARTLAVARCVVDFVDQPTPTPEFDLEKHTENGTLVSSTGQLRWTPMGAPGYDGQGYFTVDTPGTQAVVGYAQGKTAGLGLVDITSGTPFASVYVTAVEKDEDLSSGDRWLVTTIARLRNTGMVYVGRKLLKKGSSPILMEPVQAELNIKREGKATVHVLDHDGRRTGETLPMKDGNVLLDGASTQAVYYEVVFE